MKCSPEQLDHFERDGFVVVDRFLSAEQVRVATLAMERVYRGEYTSDRRPPRIRKPVPTFGNESSVHWILNARVIDGDLWDLATSAELGELAAGLLRTNSVSIVEDQLLRKPANGSPVNMHQDRAYWPFSRSDEMVTAWIALIDMTMELGPLQLIKGSHRWGLAGRPEELIRGTETQWLAAIDSLRPGFRDFEVATAVIPAGSAVLLHSLTFHGSGRNLGNTPRQAMSLHWAGERCRMDLGATAKHDFPYVFARLQDGGPIVNSYMPTVYVSDARNPSE